MAFEPDATFVPVCSSFDVPLQVVNSWVQRKTYITQAELLVLPVLSSLPEYRALLSGRDLIWFVDNQAALGAAYTAASPTIDMSEISLL